MNSPDDDLPDLLPPSRKVRPLWLRAIYFGAGIILIILGVVSGFIPGVAGILFNIAGIVCLSLASNRIREWVNRAERRWLSHRNRWRLRHWLRKIPIEDHPGSHPRGPGGGEGEGRDVDEDVSVDEGRRSGEGAGGGAGEGRRE